MISDLKPLIRQMADAYWRSLDSSPDEIAPDHLIAFAEALLAARPLSSPLEEEIEVPVCKCGVEVFWHKLECLFICHECGHRNSSARLEKRSNIIRRLQADLAQLQQQIGACYELMQRAGMTAAATWLPDAVQQYADARTAAMTEERDRLRAALDGVCGAEKCRCGHFQCVHNGAQYRGRYCCSDCDCTGFEALLSETSHPPTTTEK